MRTLKSKMVRTHQQTQNLVWVPIASNSMSVDYKQKKHLWSTEQPWNRV